MQSSLYLLQKESEFVASGEASFQNYLQHLRTLESTLLQSHSVDTIQKETDDIEQQILEQRLKLKDVMSQRHQVLQKRMALCSKSHHKQVINDALSERLNLLVQERDLVSEQIVSTSNELSRTYSSLDRYKQINAVNDAFYIWFAGPFATINTFRAGTLPNKSVEFTEINAALGQAALALQLVASRSGIEFKQYLITPLGSFPRITKVDDKRSSYPLFIDQSSFSFFPKRNFNLALLGFMHCIHEVGTLINTFDPTLALPYKLNLTDSSIGEASFVYGTDDEVWTRALKFMLADLKWIIAWYCKHGSYTSTINNNGTSNIRNGSNGTAKKS